MHADTRLISGPLQTERLSSGRRKLLRELVVECDGEQITAPEGLNTDYTSAPALVRPFIHWSRVDIAGVVHDYLYQNTLGTRRHADAVWRKVALAGEHHANLLQAWSGWLMLRIWGWRAWNNYRDNGNPHD